MRRILVGLKRVVDHSVRVHLRPDGGGVETDGVRMSVNPFCEIALEEALRIAESGRADEVVIVSVGPPECVQQLRSGLAMGAQRAIHVETATELEPLTVARCLKALVEREDPFLVLLGKQAIDADNNQTGQLLAGLWQRPQATFASAIGIDGTRATVTREIDQGSERLELDLPAVITADLRLNEPRYVRLPQLLQAKKLPVESLSPAALGIEPTGQFQRLETVPPAARPAGERVESVASLLAALERRGVIR